MSLLAEFERIYVINLAHRVDRRREMAEQLGRIGLGLDSPNVKLFPAVRPDDPGGFRSIGARGCFMSHLQVLRDAVGLRSVLILEDDMDFVPGISQLCPPVLAALPRNWGIFYGGYVVKAAVDKAPLTEMAPPVNIGTTHFIALNGPMIERAVRYLEAILTRPAGHPDGGPMDVDGAYSHFRMDNPDVRTFLACPELGYQRPSRTDIHDLRWFDRMPVVKTLAQVLRRRRAQRKRKFG